MQSVSLEPVLLSDLILVRIADQLPRFELTTLNLFVSGRLGYPHPAFIHDLTLQLLHIHILAPRVPCMNGFVSVAMCISAVFSTS